MYYLSSAFGVSTEIFDNGIVGAIIKYFSTYSAPDIPQNGTLLRIECQNDNKNYDFKSK
jgi:hypothetical protein